MRSVFSQRRARAIKTSVFVAALGLLPLTALNAATVAVNAGTKFQAIDGFGAASAWNGISNAQAPVLWTDDSAAPVSSTAAHVNGHAGLSINRMRIDPNEEANGTSAWNNEINQLVLARKTNPAITIFATEWTPPMADKENHSNQEVGSSDPANCFNGLPTTNNGTAGLASADTDYSNYLVKFVQYCNSYLTSKGAPGKLDAVSVQNEPDWNTTYESALWTGPQFQTFVGSYLGPAMQAAGLLSSTKIMLTESFPDNLGLAANTMNDPVASSYVGYLAGHLYGAPTPPRTLASAGFTHLTTQHYWETEISDLGSGTQDITTGLEEAAWIYNCIVFAGMNGYNHWWINSTGKDGFYNTSSNTWNHNFFVEGNFSKFVRPGFIRVGSTNFPEGGSGTGNAAVWTTAFVSPGSDRVVVVAVNNSTSSHTETFNLSGLGTVNQVAPWLTSSSSDLVQQALVPVSGGSFSYNLPPQSVITFVGDCLSSVPTPTRTTTSTSTRTSTPSSTRTSTATQTSTAVPTKTATATATPSRTSTSASTASSTSTGTTTRTATLSVTPTPTQTSTRTSTTIASKTATPSSTPSPSATPTRTSTAVPPSATSTPTTVPATATSSPIIPSVTSTNTAQPPTATATQTSTPAVPTATATNTLQPPTATATRTSTPILPSATATNTAQPPTVSSTRTSTPIVPSATSTVTPQPPTATRTASPAVPSATKTRTATPPFSPTRTPTPPSATATAIVSSGNGTPNILQALPGPNPNPTAISVQLDGRADYVDVKVYTVSMNLVAEDAAGTGGPGWVQVPLPGGMSNYLAAGTYYYSVQAFKAGVGSKAVTGTLVILH